MKLLIVGGTGVLSSAITNEALSKGIEVYMINRGHHEGRIPEGVRLLKSDIHDEDKVKTIVKGICFDAVIDCICYTEKHLIYSYNLFKHIAKQYVFISSCAVYNTKICSYCEEDSPKKIDIWDYSINKCKCEEKLLELAKENNTIYTIIRPCVTYGDTRIPYGIVPPYGYHWTLVERILHGKPIIKWNGGENRCNVTHVDDFAVGMVGLLGNENAYNQAFNIVGDETPTWNEVLSVLEDILEKEIITVDIPSEYYAKSLPNYAGEILGGRSVDAINSNKKITSVVPYFRQTISLKDGISRTIEYHKKNNFLNGIYYKFEAETDKTIINYYKEIKKSTVGLKLGFIDYFNRGEYKNKMIYMIFKHFDNTTINMFLKMNSVLQKIFRTLNG